MSDIDIDDLVVDLSDVKGGDFDAIPAGAYPVTISDWSTTATKNEGKLPAGTPGINWEFTVTDGQYENRKLWTNHWIHPNTMGFLKGLLKATGRYTDEELEGNLGSLSAVADKVLGAEVTAVVIVRKYQGDDRNEIKKFRKAGEASASSSGGTSMLP